MIKYMKNKNFISEKFYNKIQEKRIKKDNKLILFFLAINILLIPVSLNHIKEIQGNKIDNERIMLDSSKSSINIQEVKSWVEAVTIDYIDEAYITKNKGEIKVSTLDKVHNIDSDNRIKICDLQLNNDNKYVLGVRLNEATE